MPRNPHDAFQIAAQTFTPEVLIAEKLLRNRSALRERYGALLHLSEARRDQLLPGVASDLMGVLRATVKARGADPQSIDPDIDEAYLGELLMTALRLSDTDLRQLVRPDVTELPEPQYGAAKQPQKMHADTPLTAAAGESPEDETVQDTDPLSSEVQGDAGKPGSPADQRPVLNDHLTPEQPAGPPQTGIDLSLTREELAAQIQRVIRQQLETQSMAELSEALQASSSTLKRILTGEMTPRITTARHIWSAISTHFAAALPSAAAPAPLKSGEETQLQGPPVEQRQVDVPAVPAVSAFAQMLNDEPDFTSPSVQLEAAGVLNSLLRLSLTIGTPTTVAKSLTERIGVGAGLTLQACRSVVDDQRHEELSGRQLSAVIGALRGFTADAEAVLRDRTEILDHLIKLREGQVSYTVLLKKINSRLMPGVRTLKMSDCSKLQTGGFVTAGKIQSLLVALRNLSENDRHECRRESFDRNRNTDQSNPVTLGLFRRGGRMLILELKRQGRDVRSILFRNNHIRTLAYGLVDGQHFLPNSGKNLHGTDDNRRLIGTPGEIEELLREFGLSLLY